MKICWDNLDKFTYDSIGGCLKNKYGVKYAFMDNCDVCGEYYLMRITSPTKFCCGSCSKKGKNHPLYNKSLSKKHKKRISASNKGHKVSKETRDKISMAHKGNNYGYVGKLASNYKGGVTELNLPLYDTYHGRLKWFEDVRRAPNNNDLLQVKCTNTDCEKWFTPKRTQVCDRINAVKFDYRQGECRFYCSDMCKNTCSIYGQELYPKNYYQNKIKEYTVYELSIWSKEVLKRADYKCEYCGLEAVDSHHIKPQKLEPFFALDPDYGVACCEKCHYKYGHSDECSTSSLAKEVCI